MRILRNICITSLFMFLVFGTAGAFAQGNGPSSQMGGEQGGAPPDSGQMQGPGGGGHGPGGGGGQGPGADGGQGPGADGGQGPGTDGGQGPGTDGGQGPGTDGGQGEGPDGAQEMGPMQGQGNGPQGPRTPAGPSGYCSDSQYLYVIANGTISQYNLADLTLQASVDLPEPEVEEPDPSEETAQFEEFVDLSEAGASPRQGGGPAGVFIEGSFLYIVHHGSILQYTVPELVLQNTVEPEPVE